ncbi:sigma-70 family RNA polymerase sigma factor [Rhodopirellula bahusiensis]|uniref:sigma-70 family RNA polymerase sigma factor n=1 Tax=Rhodopirellula bahusiensis TaxID=2014065 RepID=UPI0032666082
MSTHALASSVSDGNVEHRLDEVRKGNRQSLGDLLLLYQNYLSFLAQTQIDGRLRRRMSSSDLVQETMLAAHRDFDQFRGKSEGEWLAWLRQILSNCLSHAIDRHFHAQKRDLRREVALESMTKRLDDSMARLSHFVAAKGVTPSEDMHRREMADALSLQLSKLKDKYRDVIVYRNLQGLSFEEIGRLMEMKTGTARMTWVRAISKLKEVATPVRE